MKKWTLNLILFLSRSMLHIHLEEELKMDSEIIDLLFTQLFWSRLILPKQTLITVRSTSIFFTTRSKYYNSLIIDERLKLISSESILDSLRSTLIVQVIEDNKKYANYSSKCTEWRSRLQMSFILTARRWSTLSGVIKTNFI